MNTIRDIGTSEGMTEVTLGLEPIIHSPDRNLAKARLTYVGENAPANLVLIVGLRSSILAPFDKFESTVGDFLPCDILGLVPGIAVIVSHRDKGLSASALARNEVTKLMLVLEGQPTNKIGAGDALDLTLNRVVKKWDEWTNVLLNILKYDPILKEHNIDLREFLAGESGYLTMPWFNPMSIEERTLVLDRIVLAAKSLLYSVLNKAALEDPLVKNLMNWMNQLRPLPTVQGISRVASKMEVET
ncbi:MAG: hypothetical protein RTU92_08790 [Candidatus Thorarchaeota archaeon]